MNREHSELGRAFRLKFIFLLLLLAGAGSTPLISPVKAPSERAGMAVTVTSAMGGSDTEPVKVINQ